ncbi:MAG: preprotein translocase subunit SecE [Patescibacteria group bacterium]|jgi:preprotein translocase subunit SecE
MSPIQFLQTYFRSSKAELKAVAWPTRRETVRYSVLVIGISLVFAAFFGLLDFSFTKGLGIIVANRPAAKTAQTETTDQTAPVTAGTPDVETSGGTVKVTPLEPTSPTPSVPSTK